MDTKAAPTDTPTDTDLYGADKYLKQTPKCPSSGTYTIRTMEEASTSDRPADATGFRQVELDLQRRHLQPEVSGRGDGDYGDPGERRIG
jgi:hypothetical protein